MNGKSAAPTGDEPARGHPAAAGHANVEPTAPGLVRRLVAVLYDALLLFAVLFAATAALLPFSDGEAIEPNHAGYTAYLLAVSFAYFGWLWTHGGQTLGARAWRLRVQTEDGGAIQWRHALARFAAAVLTFALLGLGFAWVLFDSRRRSLHDRLSATVTVLIPKGE